MFLIHNNFRKQFRIAVYSFILQFYVGIGRNIYNMLSNGSTAHTIVTNYSCLGIHLKVVDVFHIFTLSVLSENLQNVILCLICIHIKHMNSTYLDLVNKKRTIYVTNHFFLTPYTHKRL